MNEELKPCPFCGADAMSLYEGDLELVGCPNTSCVEFDAPMVNVASWNTRPLEDALQKEVDEIKEYEQACFVARQKDEKLWVRAMMALQEQPKLQKRIAELEIEKENWKAKYIKKIQEWKP